MVIAETRNMSKDAMHCVSTASQGRLNHISSASHPHPNRISTSLLKWINTKTNIGLRLPVYKYGIMVRMARTLLQ